MTEPECEEEVIAEFYRIFSDLIKTQRQELRKFREKDGFDDDVIRKHETQLDLEEERVKYRFDSFIGHKI
jgi:monovalent cation/hydrogen antiporter